MNTRFLDAAHDIGDRLCRDAIEYRGAYNWAGRTLEEVDICAPTLAALDGSLYDGSAGVGLFLGELAAVTGAPKHREIALGAVRHALSRPPAKASLYCGRAGVGLAAFRVGALLDDRPLSLRGAALIRKLGESAVRRLDLLDGAAGVLLALLAVNADDLALRVGEAIASGARSDGDAVVWDNGLLCGQSAGLPLAGLSHGVGGVGAALLALYTKTGVGLFRARGLGALRYEDRWFYAGNWADLRGFAPGLRPEDAPRKMVAWCHGAAGCGLARAIALRAAPGEAWLSGGLRAAARTAQTQLAKTVDTSLCHGGGGLSETLLVASQTLNEPTFLEAATRWWEAQIRRHGRRCDWPSGLPSRAPNPALMVGLAGTGHALLRLAAPYRVAPILGPISQ